MGLHNTAHYLKTKGRGDDTELVHMTKGEVHALKGLAAKHGGQLTINPETGLPEAGFLSNILPTVAGIAVGIATENPYLGAAVAGLGSYATSGSISKGLMAGISAYGGANLGASLAELGGEAGTEAAVNAGNEAIKESANKMVTSNLSAALPEGATISAETGSQISSMKDAATALKEGAITSEQYSQLANQFSQGYAPVINAATTPLSGIQALGAPGALGKFAMGNIGNIGMTAAPIFADAITKRPTLPGASTAQQSNPFGLKYLSSDFKGTFPSQPSPAYVANYPNYVQNPYNPYAPVGTPTPTTPVRAATGGLMAVPPTPGLMDGGNTANVDFMGGDMYPTSQQHRSFYATPTQMPTSAQAAMASYEPKTNPLTGETTANMREGGIASYSGKYGSMVAATDMLQNLGMPGKADYLPKGDPGIYQDTDPNTRNLDAYSAALYKLNAKAKAAGMKPEAIAKLKPVMKLGDIEEDAAGGVVGMAEGGDTSHVYKPSYANYAQNPYVQQATMTPEQLQAATAAYNMANIPAPTRGIVPSSSGYAIDPMQMVGSPAYKAEQARIAAEQAAQEAAQQQALGGPFNMERGYAGGGFVPSLGGYAAGGNPRLLKGPGDGMSDSIPANIGGKQPARLADGEFVVPADVVSHLGNGSTDAGAKKLYGMMDKIRRARTGKKKQAPEVKADKYLPR
jgi:hypothetical protein